MVASSILSVLFLAVSLVATVHPINGKLVGREVSFSTVNSRYESLSTQASQLRQSINGGSISQAEVRSRIASLCSAASQTFQVAHQCGTCYAPGTVNTLSQSASRTFREISSLAQVVSQTFGADAPSIFSSFARLDGQMSQNIQRFAQGGVATQSLLPAQLGSTFRQVGLSQTANFASQSSTSTRSSSSTQSSSSTSQVSSQTVSSRYESLSSQISQLRQSINGGSISQAEVRSRIASLSSAASQTFQVAHQCGTCYAPGTVNTLSQSASRTFREICSLAQVVSQTFGQDARSLFTPFARLDGQISQNIQRFAQGGVATQSLLPAQLGSAFRQVGLSQTANFASQSFTSTRSSSSTQSSSSTSQVSSQTVSSRYESLSSQISQLRQSINGGSISQAEVRSRIASLSSAASQTFQVAHQCGTCYAPGTVNTLSQSASRTFREICSLAQVVSQTFGQDARSLFTPFARLDGQISQNIQRFAQGGIATQSLLPAQLGPAFRQVGLSQTASFASRTSASSQTGGSFRTSF
ncbi:hypothetical protein PtA15_14A73 [Puccinia triticina]|uniref:Uncharacterized protein n=1 Tax=Puccinia triticina TaxID=208348 RepID=A0ABY7D3E3_9BASI|nr:uncharacterized protein PtA15_14A73 [Puccinia triticina]WAQ91192.1 hypothetical protein PtA15_14A73 [Puccinia triticina]